MALKMIGSYIISSVFLSVIFAQYNTQSPYDRDRTDRPYDRPYDRQNQNDRNPYDRQNSQYDRNNPYDRNQYNLYNNSQYDRYNGTQYSSQSPSYNDNRDRYDTRDPNRDRHNTNNNRDQYYIGNNRDQYGTNRDQYGNNRDQYGTNRDQYGNNRDQYGNNRDQYGTNRDQFGTNRDQYGNNRDQYGNNRDQYGSNRDQYGNNRDQYGNNRDMNDRNRNRYDGTRNDELGGQYGSPNFNTNDDCCPEYCYRKDEQPYVHFGSKTAYQIVFGKASNQHRIPDCTPIQFWSINRDGTRYPSARTIDRLRNLRKIHAEIIRNYEEKRSYPDRGKLCPDDLDLLKRWQWNETVNERNANSLTNQGIMDLKFLARRYASRFEELMREPYSESAYSFQYTDTDRTHDSYQAFIEGLFKEQAFQVHANVFNTDQLIKPTGTCNAWINRVDQNPDAQQEYMRFRHKQEYQQMVRDVFRRLGFRYTLNDSILNDMYDLCRYEKAWDLDHPSPWCIAFNKDQLKLLEYAEDLKSFYHGGYGNPINKRVGCPPVKDLYEKFERTVNNNGNPGGNKVTVFFTHSITIQTFLTAMGIANDHQPLTADNYYQQRNRQWRTSIIDPFGANVAAVLYQCRSAERYRVMFFLNEVPVSYPDCSVGLCNWSTVQNKLRSVAENCNMDFCDRNAAAVSQTTYLIYIINFIAIIFITFRY